MTRITARLRTALCTAAALTLAATGCGTGTPPPSGTPTPTASTPAASLARPTVTASGTPTASPTPPPTDAATIFAADGVGPYIIGTALTELQGRGLVTGIADSPLCVDSKSATATAPYAGVVSLSFAAGRLVSIHTASDTLVTPSGVRVGLPLADVQARYGGRGTVLTSTGGTKSLVVRVTATTLALVLTFDPATAKVSSMSGGEADRLETAARTGEGC